MFCGNKSAFITSYHMGKYLADCAYVRSAFYLIGNYVKKLTQKFVFELFFMHRIFYLAKNKHNYTYVVRRKDLMHEKNCYV